MIRNAETIRADIIAGITGAVAGAPQSMGFALIAGVSPIYGLYGAVVATIVGTLTSSSTFMTIAPTNALSLLVFSTIAADGTVTIEKLFLLTFLTGVFQLLFGLLRLGNLTRFVSNAVMTGFILGAGALIILGQVANLNAYKPDYQGLWATELTKTIPNLYDWIIHLPQSQPQTLITGIVAIAIIAGLRRTRFKSVATILAIVLTTIMIEVLNWTSVPVVGEIPGGLPAPVIPPFEYTLEILPAALAMAILALVQSSGITATVPEPDGSHADANRDFIAQGLANIAGGFFQSLTSGGSLSRTAVNIAAGAKTRLSNLTAAIVIALILLVFGDVIERIPLAAIAGQLIVAAFSLFNFKTIGMVWTVNRSGRTAMLATFISTLFLPLEYSIYIGVVLSLVLFVYTAATRLQVVRIIPLENNQYQAVNVPEKLPPDEVIIFSVNGHMYFAAVRELEHVLPNPETSENTIVILRIRSNQYLGSTGIRFLQEYKHALEKHGSKFILAGVSEKLHGQLERTRMEEEFGVENIFYATDIYFEATGHAYTYATGLLNETTPA